MQQSCFYHLPVQHLIRWGIHQSCTGNAETYLEMHPVALELEETSGSGNEVSLRSFTQAHTHNTVRKKSYEVCKWIKQFAFRNFSNETETWFTPWPCPKFSQNAVRFYIVVMNSEETWNQIRLLTTISTLFQGLLLIRKKLNRKSSVNVSNVNYR